MHPLQQDILQALGKVYDPDLKKDLVSLDMVDQLEVKGHTISFTLILTTPACPLQETLKKACIQAIREVIKDDLWDIVIHLTSKVTTPHHTTTILGEVKNIIAIASGKGGVGKSTVATHLALALANHGAQVGLLDADLFGPSIPAMWNCEGKKPIIKERAGKKYIQPIEQHQVKLLSMGFLAQEALLWRGPMASAALKQLIQETDWGALDYLLIDLPPGTSDIHLTLQQTVPLTGAVMVTTPQKIALIDAIKAISMFRKAPIQVPILGLIENMSYFATNENAIHYIFGQEGGKQLATQAAIPFLGQVPLLIPICQEGDKGMVSGSAIPPFDTIAQLLAQQIAIHNATP